MRARARRKPEPAGRCAGRFGAVSCGGEFEDGLSHSVVPDRCVVGLLLLDRLPQVLLHGGEHARAASPRLGRRRARRAPSPSAPRRATLRRSSSGRAAGVRNSRLARRSSGSARRSIRPLSASPSSSRVRRDRLQVEHLGELGLLEALEAVEPGQHRPFRPRHAEAPRLVVRVGPQQASYIIDRKS